MIELLVGVIVGRLEEHFLRLLSQLVLFIKLDAILYQLDVTLLLTQLASLDGLLFDLFCGLEINLCLQVSCRVVSANTLRLSQVAWRIRTWLMLKESVRVGWFRTESRSRHKF